MTPNVPALPSGPGQQGNPTGLILSLLAGSGFGNFASGVKKIADSGMNLNELSQMPNFPLLLAGAGIKDSANSMELVKPMMQMLMPPPPPPQAQINPAHLAAAQQMMGAKMGPGLSGITPPTGM